MKTLLLIPSVAKLDSGKAVASDEHPTMDYNALVGALRSDPESQVELVDYASVKRDTHPLVRSVRRLLGLNAALALTGFLRRREFDAIFSNAESVALPLALLFRTVSKRPRHVTIGHRLSARKKALFFRWLGVHSEMDTIFVYATTQRSFALDTLGIPDEKVRLIHFHADHRFYRPLQDVSANEEQICSAGLEWRDYPTLIEAVADRSELAVRLAAASPWSKGVNETEQKPLPKHIQSRRYEYRALRELYAESSFVVVPLYDNDFQAGITTILEAMAMGKAVVATRTRGQTDVLVEGVTGIYVPAGDPEAWKIAIERLRSDPTLRARLGQQARRWVEENATLDLWVEHVVGALEGVAPSRVSAPPRNSDPGRISEPGARTRRLSLAPSIPTAELGAATGRPHVSGAAG